MALFTETKDRLMTEYEKMRHVIILAENALTKGEFPISCMIFYKVQILYQTHTSENEDKRVMVHAEFKALMELDR